jgi:hypothetical protein
MIPAALSSLDDNKELQKPLTVPIASLATQDKLYQRIFISELFSGKTVVYSPKTAKWLVSLIFVGVFEDMYMLLERNSRALFALQTADAHEHFLWGELTPLLLSEVGTTIEIARQAALTPPLATMDGPGFVSPLFDESAAKTFVSLPKPLLAHLLRTEDNRTFYIPQGKEGLFIGFQPSYVPSGRDLARDGLFGRLMISNRTLLGPDIAVLPRQLQSLLGRGVIYVDGRPFGTTTPRVKAPREKVVSVPCAKLAILPVGTTMYLQVHATDSWRYATRFIAVGTSAITGKDVLVVQVQGTPAHELHVLLCSAFFKASVHAEQVVPEISTKFASFSFRAKPVPLTYKATKLSDAPGVQTFYDVARDYPCIKNAWVQSEGTCWATAVLNLLTLVPTLRDAFVSAPIQTEIKTPHTRAALAIQRTIACKTMDDAPFCAFKGPEMVCTLLRVGLNGGRGRRPETQFKALCDAAGIPLGDGVHSTEERFQFVQMRYVIRGEDIKTPPKLPWDIESHAAGAIIVWNALDAGHAFCGVRCALDDPAIPAAYLLMDGGRLFDSPLNWLDAAEGKQYSAKYLSDSFKYPNVFLFELWVLFDLGVTFPTRSLVTWEKSKTTPKPPTKLQRARNFISDVVSRHLYL